MWVKALFLQPLTRGSVTSVATLHFHACLRRTVVAERAIPTQVTLVPIGILTGQGLAYWRSRPRVPCLNKKCDSQPSIKEIMLT